MTTIEVEDPAVEAIPESERVLVGENVTCRLAQERASYRVLRYVLPVVKRRDTGSLVHTTCRQVKCPGTNCP